MPVKFHDYYKTLGIERPASQEEIQKAYRRMARKYHPDLNKSAGAEAKFKEIGEAYEVLRDPDKRKRYDTLGADWQAGQEFTPPPEWGGGQFRFGGPGGGATFRTSGEAGQFSDFFRMFFGDSTGGMGGMGGLFGGGANESPWGGSAQPEPARDQESEIEIALEEAYRGAAKKFSLEFLERSPSGGMERTRRGYDVKIPAGVTNGSRIRLAGQGGGRGDLYLKVRIRKHPRFELDGRNLTQTIDVAPWEAALGAEVSVPTLDTKVSMKVPAGTSSGQVLRLKGKGLPKRGGTPGDMLVKVRIVVPKDLGRRERELFEALARESGFKPRD
ncbi:DnaJ domain-containing protein [Candidatus Sumerlaeota bacterium]|nr:DnaJ domain-containing protein [Candidatus Sumerlaeota bacterium]